MLKKALADDEQSKRHVEQPKMCVDYLSYKFDEMDLAASWRVMTKQKKEVVDGIRLENASWRTWAKQRNNLKTVSPQTLNWLKDSDVTWLYGPLHTVIRGEEDMFLAPKKQTTEETLNLMMPNKKPILKPALKKLTEKDLLKRSAKKNPTITRKLSISEANNQTHALSPVVLADHHHPRLRFNHEVEQCIAVTDPTEGDDSSDDELIERKKSIKIIAPARLKRSQSDAETESNSSCSSLNEIFSVTEETHISANQSNYNRPALGTKRPSSSSIVKEKSNVAEPALVTTHQTATDIQKDDGRANTNLLNHIASWASSYLWPSKSNHNSIVYKEK